MAMSSRLRDYLDRQEVSYQVLRHEEVFKAPEVAQALHAPEKEMAKVVMVNVDGRLVMTVLPASWKVDLQRLRRVFLARDVRLAIEDEFRDRFPDCEVGAMPPFGNLYDLEVYADHCLTEDEHIIFQAGSHTDAVSMRYTDYAALVHPVVAEFHREPLEIW